MICPFCGVETDVPHENQEGCIQALTAEIGRMRTLLEAVRSAEVPRPQDSAPEPDDESEESY